MDYNRRSLANLWVRTTTITTHNIIADEDKGEIWAPGYHALTITDLSIYWTLCQGPEFSENQLNSVLFTFCFLNILHFRKYLIKQLNRLKSDVLNGCLKPQANWPNIHRDMSLQMFHAWKVSKIFFCKNGEKNPPSPWRWSQNLCVHQVSSSKSTCMK